MSVFLSARLIPLEVLMMASVTVKKATNWVQITNAFRYVEMVLGSMMSVTMGTPRTEMAALQTVKFNLTTSVKEVMPPMLINALCSVHNCALCLSVLPPTDWSIPALALWLTSISVL